MFTPFRVFVEKKFGSADGEENGNEVVAGGKNEEEAIEMWNGLSNKKKLKFIKKAEKKYDKSEGEKQPFHCFLSDRELNLLLKSYGLPERPPPNSKLFSIHKYKSSNENGEDSDKVKAEAEENWKNLQAKDKSDILDEFHKCVDDYELKYVDFVRSLPEQRIDDFKHYLAQKKKPHTKKEPNVDGAKKTKAGKPKNIKYSLKLFIPHDIYYEKTKKETTNEDTTKEFARRAASRSAYKALSNKKKLKYIKEAEANYDSYDFGNEMVKPRLSYFLTREETELLLGSYGLPEIVPGNISAYFVKKMVKTSPGVSMEKLFETYRGFNEEEKSKLMEEFKSEKEASDARISEFLQSLPPSRVEDFNYMRSKHHKRPSDENGADEPAKKKKKILKVKL